MEQRKPGSSSSVSNVSGMERNYQGLRGGRALQVVIRRHKPHHSCLIFAWVGAMEQCGGGRVIRWKAERRKIGVYYINMLGRNRIMD